MTGGPVSLAAGTRLMLDGAQWMVEECWPQSGRVVLRDADGTRRPVTIRALVNDPGFGPATAGDEPPGRTGPRQKSGGRARSQLQCREARTRETRSSVKAGQWRDRLVNGVSGTER
jgi:hypothetical protein